MTQVCTSSKLDAVVKGLKFLGQVVYRILKVCCNLAVHDTTLQKLCQAEFLSDLIALLNIKDTKAKQCIQALLWTLSLNKDIQNCLMHCGAPNCYLR